MTPSCVRYFCKVQYLKKTVVSTSLDLKVNQLKSIQDFLDKNEIFGSELILN